MLFQLSLPFKNYSVEKNTIKSTGVPFVSTTFIVDLTSSTVTGTNM